MIEDYLPLQPSGFLRFSPVPSLGSSRASGLREHHEVLFLGRTKPAPPRVPPQCKARDEIKAEQDQFHQELKERPETRQRSKTQLWIECMCQRLAATETGLWTEYVTLDQMDLLGLMNTD